MLFTNLLLHVECRRPVRERSTKTLAAGRYPEKLDQLVPEYVKQLPLDPMNGQPLHYRRTEGGFVLYSVRQNQRDDGGRTWEDQIRCNEGWDDYLVRVRKSPLPESLRSELAAVSRFGWPSKLERSCGEALR